MRGALAGRDRQFPRLDRVTGFEFLDFGSSAWRSEANRLTLGERENFFLSLELIERNGKQMAVGQVAQTPGQRPARGAGAQNKSMRFIGQQRLEKAES